MSIKKQTSKRTTGAPPNKSLAQQRAGKKRAAVRVTRATAVTLPAAGSEPFSGFSEDAIAFLAELEANNDREWFKANQERYERSVRERTRSFIRAMGPEFRKLSPHVVVSDKKVGGSMMRPQRDTRFSPNKDPYKTNVGVQFRHVAGKDVHAPGFYFHFDRNDVFVGVGMWHPEAEALLKVRQRIADKPGLWKKATGSSTFKRRFRLEGESLRRPPKGFDAAHPLIDELKRKDFIAVCHLDPDLLFQKKLVAEVAAHFRAASPFMTFLSAAIGIEY